jgi:Tfp pilus assembly pilus retraction ATPase PilT
MTAQELLSQIFLISSEKNYPDIHLNTGSKPLVRDTNGNIIVLNSEYPLLSKDAISEIIRIVA